MRWRGRRVLRLLRLGPITEGINEAIAFDEVIDWAKEDRYMIRTLNART